MALSPMMIDSLNDLLTQLDSEEGIEEEEYDIELGWFIIVAPKVAEAIQSWADATDGFFYFSEAHAKDAIKAVLLAALRS